MSQDIYVIDRCRIFRDCLRAVIVGPEFRICGEASSIDEAVKDFGGSHPPDLTLAEYPDVEPELLSQLGAGEGAPRPRTKVVVLAARMNYDWLRRSFAAGADAYLTRNMSSDALLHSLRLVLTGEKVLPSDLAELLLNGSWVVDDEEATEPHRDLSSLSERERDVLQHLILGHSNKIIARHLNIAEGTVKVHLKAVLKKLHLSNRTQAAIWANNNRIGRVAVSAAPAAEDAVPANAGPTLSKLSVATAESGKITSVASAASQTSPCPDAALSRRRMGSRLAENGAAVCLTDFRN
jgi:two-component system nitrate/nitrite response regulator NarL